MTDDYRKVLEAVIKSMTVRSDELKRRACEHVKELGIASEMEERGERYRHWDGLDDDAHDIVRKLDELFTGNFNPEEA